MNANRLGATVAAAALLLGAAGAEASTTLDAGGGVAFSNYQPSLALTLSFGLDGLYPVRSSGGLTDGATDSTIGMVRTLGTNFNPVRGNADGSSISTAAGQGVILNLVIGGAYGSSPGAIALPDLRGVTIIGASSVNGQGAIDGYQVGRRLGSATTVLTASQLPVHSHTLPGGGVTTSVGAGAPISQLEPSLTMTYLINTGGIYPGSGAAVSIGQVATFAGDYVPEGWRPADGSLLTIAGHASLYSVIGTTYGGDGVTTFALPDLRGRTIVGVGTGTGLAPVTLGEAFGSATTVLSLGQMAGHDHGLPGGGATGAAGGATPVSNAQPSLGLTYLVATLGAYPPRDAPELSSDQIYLGEIVAFAGGYVPNGFALADGSLLSIATNSALFSLFGTNYGGNGTTTFALPDLRGRDVIGAGAGFSVGQTVGTQSTVLTEANLPVHSHDLPAVPEPSTWTMLILGLGLAGAGLRRRASAVAV